MHRLRRSTVLLSVIDIIVLHYAINDEPAFRSEADRRWFGLNEREHGYVVFDTYFRYVNNRASADLSRSVKRPCIFSQQPNIIAACPTTFFCNLAVPQSLCRRSDSG